MMQNPNIPEDWKQTIRGYVPKDEREAAEKAEILTLIDREGERLLTRDCAYAHVTASSADGETDLLHVAMREAREETGIERLRQIGNGAASLEILPVWAHVKRGKAVGSHLHLNVSYLFEADDSLPLRVAEDENSAVGWIAIDRLAESVREKDMLPTYEKLLNRTNVC